MWSVIASSYRGGCGRVGAYPIAPGLQRAGMLSVEALARMPLERPDGKGERNAAYCRYGEEGQMRPRTRLERKRASNSARLCQLQVCGVDVDAV
jgi:hypothetical protein